MKWTFFKQVILMGLVGSGFGLETTAQAQNVPAQIAESEKQGLRSAVQVTSALPESRTGSGATALESAAQGRSLRVEFRKAQVSYLQAEKHRQTTEIKEIRAVQKVRKAEWEQKEKLERKTFFDQNREGPKRREYVKNFLQRRKDFLQFQRDELTSKMKEHRIRMESIRAEQKDKHKEFDSQLKQGLQPRSELWP